MSVCAAVRATTQSPWHHEPLYMHHHHSVPAHQPHADESGYGSKKLGEHRDHKSEKALKSPPILLHFSSHLQNSTRTPSVNHLFDILRTLLSNHEVKLAMLLLDNWASEGKMASSRLAVSHEEFQKSLNGFLRQQWSDRVSSGGSGISTLQTFVSESVGKTTARRDSNSRKVTRAVTEVSQTRSEESRAHEKRRISDPNTLSPLRNLEDAVASAASEVRNSKTNRRRSTGASNHMAVDLPNRALRPNSAPPMRPRINSDPTQLRRSNCADALSELVRFTPPEIPTPSSPTAPATPELCIVPVPGGLPESLSQHILNAVAQHPDELNDEDQKSNSVQSSPSSVDPAKQPSAGLETSIPAPTNEVPKPDRSPHPLSTSISTASAIPDTIMPRQLRKQTSFAASINQTQWISRCSEDSVRTSSSSGQVKSRNSSHNCSSHAPSRISGAAQSVAARVIAFSTGLGRFRSEKDSNSGFDPRVTKAKLINEMWFAIPSHIWIVHPSGAWRMFWDILALKLILLECVLMPFSIGFDWDQPDWMLWASTAFFAVDMPLNFVTGYFEDGILVMKQREIALNYVKSWFFLDLLSTFPWGSVFEFGASGTSSMLRLAKVGKMLRMLRLLRVAKLNALFDQFEDLFHSSMWITTLKLFKIMAIVFLVCHWCACIWGWLGEPSQYLSPYSDRGLNYTICEPGGPCEPGIGGSAWRRRYGLDSEPLMDQYLYSLRFAAGLFTGSDIGIQPGFWAERVFVVLTMFASFIALSTIISKIVIMFHKISQDHHDQEELMMQFKEFMAAGRVPYSLQAKIKRYLEYQYRSRRDLQVRRFEMIERLSPWLRKELQVHLNRSVLAQHPFFKTIGRDLLQHVCCIAESVLCAPGDVVMQRGQKVQGMYFLVRGKLHVNYGIGNQDEDLEFSVASSKSTNPQQDDGLRSNASSQNARWRASVTRLTRIKGEDQFTIVGGFLLHAPGFIAATSLFEENVLPYTVCCVYHTELLTICRDAFGSLKEEFPAFRRGVERYLRDVVPRKGYTDCSVTLNAKDSKEAPPGSTIDSGTSSCSLESPNASQLGSKSDTDATSEVKSSTPKAILTASSRRVVPYADAEAFTDIAGPCP